MKKGTRGIKRRDFIKTAAAATAGLVIVKPESVRGAPANSALRVGIIGCGGRGRFVGRFFPEFTNSVVVAVADPFKDRVDRIRGELKAHVERVNRKGAARGKVAITDNHCFVGLDGYKGLLQSGVDAVVITSPPYFHPEQAMAAIEAGKHVYIAKPVAVDVPGCKTIIAASRKARPKLSFLVDFQTRSTDLFIEAARRVHQGAIGRLVCGQIFYQTSRLRPQADPNDKSDAARLRNWVFDKVLSGDVIVEQHIHVLDVSNWYIGSHPLRAYGTGGRMARTDVGDCWDHFICIYWYPDDVKIDFSSSQFLKGFHDMCMRVYGTKGTVDSHYGGPVTITGDNPWKGGSTPNIYRNGAVANVRPSWPESSRASRSTTARRGPRARLLRSLVARPPIGAKSSPGIRSSRRTASSKRR